MAKTQTDIESRIVALSSESFNAFCEDISGMSGVDIGCEQKGVVTETIKGLKKRFKKLVAVSSVKSEGALDAMFQLVFDKEGLFILAGVIVSLAEQEILQHIKHGTKKDAEDVSDAIGEVANILVGSWDKVFNERLDGHKQLDKTNTFVGNPWDNPEKQIGLSSDEEFLFVPFGMTVVPYPPFNCGVIFPKTAFGKTSEFDNEQTTSSTEEAKSETEEKTKEKVEEKKADDTVVEQEDTEETKLENDEPPAEDKAEERIESEKETISAEGETEAKKSEDEDGGDVSGQTDASNEPKSDDAGSETKEAVVVQAHTEPHEPTKETKSARGKVTKAILKMTQSRAGMPGEGPLVSLSLCARDIMQKEIIWGNIDDSVQLSLTRMQEAGADYMMVGKDGVLEGIISRSDITGVVSCYLRPIFAKWRRPLDDATLNIKIKWIMSRPVHTIKYDTSLAEIMENMNKLGRRCLPVVDEHGMVQGQVTVFDVFQALLNR